MKTIHILVGIPTHITFNKKPRRQKLEKVLVDACFCTENQPVEVSTEAMECCASKHDIAFPPHCCKTTLRQIFKPGDFVVALATAKLFVVA